MSSSKRQHYNIGISKVDAQIARTRDEENSPKNTTLYFNLLLESKDLARGVFSLIEEYHNGMKGQ